MKNTIAVDLLNRLKDLYLEEDEYKKLFAKNEERLFQKLNTITNEEDLLYSVKIVLLPYKSTQQKIEAIDCYLNAKYKHLAYEVLINKNNIANSKFRIIIKDLNETNLEDAADYLYTYFYEKPRNFLNLSDEDLQESINITKSIRNVNVFDSIFSSLINKEYIRKGISTKIAKIKNNCFQEKFVVIIDDLLNDTKILDSENCFEVLEYISKIDINHWSDISSFFENEYAIKKINIYTGLELLVKASYCERSKFVLIKNILGSKKFIDNGTNFELAETTYNASTFVIKNIQYLVDSEEIQGNILVASKSMIKSPNEFNAENIKELVEKIDLKDNASKVYDLINETTSSYQAEVIRKYFETIYNIDLQIKIAKYINNSNFFYNGSTYIIKLSIQYFNNKYAFGEKELLKISELMSKSERNSMYIYNYCENSKNINMEIIELLCKAKYASYLYEIIFSEVDYTMEDLKTYANYTSDVENDAYFIKNCFLNTSTSYLKYLCQCKGELLNLMYFVLTNKDLINLGINYHVANVILDTEESENSLKIIFAKDENYKIVHKALSNIYFIINFGTRCLTNLTIDIFKNKFGIEIEVNEDLERIRIESELKQKFASMTYIEKMIYACENTEGDIDLKEISRGLIKRGGK